MNRAPIPPPHPEPEPANPILVCPYCGHKVGLSWRRYWNAPTGKHLCSACRQKSKLTLPFHFRLLTFATGALLPIPAVFYTTLLFPSVSNAVFLFWLGGYAVVSLILDKYLESKHGVLRKLK